MNNSNSNQDNTEKKHNNEKKYNTEKKHNTEKECDCEEDCDCEKETIHDKIICYGSFYSIMHTIILFFAVYLSWRCNNNKFNPVGICFAICCPILYIIYALGCYGGCGIFETVPISKPTQ